MVSTFFGVCTLGVLPILLWTKILIKIFQKQFSKMQYVLKGNSNEFRTHDGFIAVKIFCYQNTWPLLHQPT